MKFVISSITSPFGEPAENITNNNPESAVLKWFQMSEKYPACTSLQPDTKESGEQLLKWADMNSDKIEAWANIYKCPYKIKWLKEQIRTQVKNNKCSMQWEYDELFPFCMG